ncbi:C40 family peptidase [Paenibacillus abyssi]|uniref:NlpC/P60 domain-containing protein n=1 Tax=Paenibacillus abyssi TaxID=1340531 RepID=A0A917D2A2_9BACL|nr:C40 family peptidase [Paenibacillus abyssi]GGG08739.1 hypothetical protein GCM10010916_26980 [Paenibacillus abyssi]
MRSKNFLKKIVSVSLCATIGLSALTLYTPQAEASPAKKFEVIETGKQFLGTPYRFGAPAGITSAFDCSSFTQFIFRQYDIKLPRTTTEQAKAGVKVTKGYLSTGDLVFFNTNGKSISHVGIYAGNNKILHGSSSQGIAISNMNSSYWKSKYVTARRVL